MLDKNTNRFKNEGILSIKKELEKNTINSIVYSEPSSKSVLFNALTKKFSCPLLYLDFDLLYTGYTTAGIMSLSENVVLFQPTFENLKSTLVKILCELSQKKSVIIIDSLNGFFNIFDKIDNSGRLVNSYLMLISSAAKISNSIVIIACMAKLNEESQWTLFLTGRRILESQFSNKFYLEKENSKIVFSALSEKNSKQNSVQIEYDSIVLE